MASILARTFFVPLKIAPNSFSTIEILYSPSIQPQSGEGGKESNQYSSSSSSSPPRFPFFSSDILPKLIESCPSLHGPNARFSPSPQLPSGHLQTLYSAIANTTAEDIVYYRRKVILTPDGGLISIDIAEAEDDDKDGKETVVISHGLTGGSQESYVRHCVRKLIESKQKGGLGFRCAVVNFRGCAHTPITSPQLYSAAKTSDLRSALLFLTSIYPKSPMVGLSFSLGANVMSKYLGEDGDDAVYLGGIACAAPYDLKAGSDVLEHSTTRRAIYSRAMSDNLTRVVRKHAATLQLDESLRQPIESLLHVPTAKKHAEKRGEKYNTLRYVDDAVVRFLGGHRTPYGEFPFDSADHYYSNGGAAKKLHGLKRPLLSLNADDDPIVAKESIREIMSIMGLHPTASINTAAAETGEETETKVTKDSTDFIVMATTQGGGHLGWWTGLRHPVRWLREPVAEFCAALFFQARGKCEGKAQSGTKAYDNRKIRKDRVVVELIPQEELPPYDESLHKERKEERKQSNGMEHKIADSTTAKKGARLPWLRTHLLSEAPLVHPSMAPRGWCGRKPAFEQDVSFKIDVHGDIDGQSEKSIKDWLTFEGVMTRDVNRPEVGFLQLGEWTRVAGAGERFQGAKDTPGQYGTEESKDDGMVAGL